VHPRVAVVSVGLNNDYGHPDPGLLAAATAAGILVGRTDLDGSIAVVVEKGQLRLVDAP
jgi:competence protein ComEC